MVAPTYSVPAIPPTVTQTGDAKAGRPSIDLKDLLAGGREVQIAHQEQVYVLRLTRSNKLILTK